MATKRRRVTPVPVSATVHEPGERQPQQRAEDTTAEHQDGGEAGKPSAKSVFPGHRASEFIQVHDQRLALVPPKGQTPSEELLLEGRALKVVDDLESPDRFHAVLQSDRRLLVFETPSLSSLSALRLMVDTVVPVQPSQLKALRLEAGIPRLLVADQGGLRWLRFQPPVGGFVSEPPILSQSRAKR